jgi:hypothetical protein
MQHHKIQKHQQQQPLVLPKICGNEHHIYSNIQDTRSVEQDIPFPQADPQDSY